MGFNMNMFFKIFFGLGLMFSLMACTLGSSLGSSQVFSRGLSLHDSHFTTCVFNPSTQVAHFPMWHFPYGGGYYSPEEEERVVRSQFQLLHTVIDYKQSRQLFLLDEHIAATEDLNEEFFQRLLNLPSGNQEFFWIRAADGQRFYYKEQMETMTQAFSSGWPLYYENLHPIQKRILRDHGAGMTLYLTGQIPRLYKVIDESTYAQVQQRLRSNPYILSSTTACNSVIFGPREEALGREVRALQAQHNSPNSFFLIAYGANHDFSRVFFDEGPLFESGHRSCLSWTTPPNTCNPFSQTLLVR